MSDKDTVFRMRVYRDANGVLKEDHNFGAMSILELQSLLNYLLARTCDTAAKMNEIHTDQLNYFTKPRPSKFADEDLR